MICKSLKHEILHDKFLLLYSMEINGNFQLKFHGIYAKIKQTLSPDINVLFLSIHN